MKLIWILAGVSVIFIGYTAMKKKRPTLDNPTPDFTNGYKRGLGDAMSGLKSDPTAGKSSDWLYGYQDGYKDGISLPA